MHDFLLWLGGLMMGLPGGFVMGWGTMGVVGLLISRVNHWGKVSASHQSTNES